MSVHRRDNGAGSVEPHGPGYRWDITVARVRYRSRIFEYRRDAERDLTTWLAAYHAGDIRDPRSTRDPIRRPDNRQLSLAA